MKKTKGTALVTGAAKRVGRELALYLAGNGYSIALHYNHSKEEAEETKRLVEVAGEKAVLFQADLFHENEACSLIEAVHHEFSDLNILVNNASVFEKGTLSETSPELFNRQFNINFRAPYLLTQQFSHHCSQGLVVNFLDVRIDSDDFEHFAYTISKKALAAFTKSAALELAPSIRVNGIAPGILLPPEGKDEAYLDELVQKTPGAKRAKMVDVVKAMDLFLKDKSRTGEILFVDGREIK